MNQADLINIESPAKKRIALVAHDNMKSEMLEWAKAHREILSQHVLLGTGTTGRLVAESTFTSAPGEYFYVEESIHNLLYVRIIF